MKNLKECLISEAKKSGWYGTSLQVVWHGEWADPEITDGEKKCNYWDLENSLYDEYRSENNIKGDDEKGFEKWMKNKDNQNRAEEIFAEIAE